MRKKSKSLWLLNIWPLVIHFQLASKLYVYLFSHGCSLHWRGVWSLFDDYIYNDQNESHWYVLAVTTICTAALVGLKSVRNLLVPPTVIVTDSKEFVFNFPTRFRTEVSFSVNLNLFICFLSLCNIYKHNVIICVPY